MKHISHALQNIAAPDSFSGQYANERWKDRAKEFRRSYGHCSSCRREKVELHVHHVNYERGKAIWDAQDTDLVALCKSCHELIHHAIREFRASAARCNAPNVAAICLALKLMLQKHGETETIKRLIKADEA